MPNPMGKTRGVDAPYLIITNDFGWEYRVLKAYTTNPGKNGASWLCAVKSPYTAGGWDMGDTYVTDVRGTVTFRDAVVPDSVLPSHLGGTVSAAPNPLDAFIR